MTTHWQIRVKDTGGNLVAVLDDTGGFSRASISQTVNKTGTGTVEFPALDSRRDLFVLDGPVEFWRSNKVWGLDWYREWVGFYRDPTDEEQQDGNPRFVAHVVGPEDFLARREIAYKDITSSQVMKSGAGETVIKEYVDENAGPSATTGNGRKRTGTLSGFSIEADQARGSTWSGSRSYEKLLKVVQEIAQATGLDFEMDMNANPSTFTFRIHELLGDDRSKEGLCRSTGKNMYGNSPVIFSREAGTLRHPVRSSTRKQEVNVAFVLGRGEGSNRSIEVVENTDLSDDSPWNDIEASVSAGNEDDVNLISRGQTFLAEKAPVEEVNFELVQKEKSLYGLHYFLGDIVAVELLNMDLRMKITGADMAMESSIEAVNFRYEEVSRR